MKTALLWVGLLLSPLQGQADEPTLAEIGQIQATDWGGEFALRTNPETTDDGQWSFGARVSWYYDFDGLPGSLVMKQRSEETSLVGSLSVLHYFPLTKALSVYWRLGAGGGRYQWDKYDQFASPRPLDSQGSALVCVGQAGFGFQHTQGPWLLGAELQLQTTLIPEAFALRAVTVARNDAQLSASFGYTFGSIVGQLSVLHGVAH